MPSETNNTTDEFSPVLRRYLRERQRVDCHGFDLDLATAYLEKSLIARECLDYEAHLADCLSCRQHLVELLRLFELTADTGPVADVLPLREVVPVGPARNNILPGRGWFEALRETMSAPFRMPAFGLVGLALLVAFVTVGIVWNRDSQGEPTSEALARRDEPAGTVVQSSVEVGPEGTASEPSDTTEARPAPSVTPKPATSGGRQSKADPVPVIPAESNGTSSTFALAPAPDRPNLPPSAQIDRQIPALSSPSPAIGPQSGLQLNVNSGQRSSNSSAFRIPDFGRVNGFASPRQRRSAANTSDGDQVTAVRVIHGKTFKLEGRTWVDQDFHQLMRSSGSVTLVYGDQTYENLVADNPMLADFFSLRAVTLVWNGKVYRVLAR